MLVCFGFIVRPLTRVRPPPSLTSCCTFLCFAKTLYFCVSVNNCPDLQIYLRLVPLPKPAAFHCISLGKRLKVPAPSGGKHADCFAPLSPELLFNTDAGVREPIAAAGSQPDSGLRPKTTDCLELVVLETCLFSPR